MHALTRKGEGYGPAETDDEKRLHDIGVFDPETGVPQASSTSSYTGAFAAELVRLGEEHPELVAITAGMPGSTGLLPFAERFPDRCLDVGIAEQHAVTAAAGMAMRGLRPLVAVYSTFLSRAWDQLLYDVGLHGLPVVFCVDRAGITGDDGPSHHGLYDLALLTKVPGMTVYAPSSYEEVAVMLDDAMRVVGAGGVAVVEDARPPRGARGDRPRSHAPARCGAAPTCACSRWARWSRRAEEAAELLVGRGVSATVWDMRVVPARHPHARRRRCVTGSWSRSRTASRRAASGAWSAARSARLEHGGSAPTVLTLGTPLTYVPHGKPAAILANLGLDATGIAATIQKSLDPS